MSEEQTIIAVINEKVTSILGHVKATNGKVAAQEKEIFNIKLKMGNEPLNKQYASKTTEKLMYAFVGIILIGVVGQWLNLIVVKNDFEKSVASEVEAYLEATVEQVEHNN